VDIDAVVQEAWREHAENPEASALLAGDALAAVSKVEEIAPLAQLITHLYGEHLQRYREGIAVLERFRASRAFGPDADAAGSVARGIAALELASGTDSGLSRFESSDRVRILTMAAAAACAGGNTERAADLFGQALAAVDENVSRVDPAARALAVAGNNLAAMLEEKPDRSAQERELMLLAARVARKFWEIAGTFTHVERAEYRLARSCLEAGEIEASSKHAEACIAICGVHGADAREVFFGYEALARARAAARDELGFHKALAEARRSFASATAEQQVQCRASLERLEKLL
jgi:hypothetical protein